MKVLLPIDMQIKKPSIVASRIAFNLEVNAVIFLLQIRGYDMEGVTVTASFKETNVETQILSVEDNLITLPIVPSYVVPGVNNFQINFRKGEVFEQSPVINWYVNTSVAGTSSGEYTDLLLEILTELNDLSQRVFIEDIESEDYSFAILDSLGKPALVIANNGIPIVNKLSVNDNVFKEYSAEGYSMIVTDKLGKVSDIRLDSNGNFRDEVIDMWRARNLSRSKLVCWGDSLTFGAGGNLDGWHVTDYPKTLSELTGLPVINNGVQGEGTIEIMARQGANPLIVQNITIPSTCTKIKIGEKNGISTKNGKYSKVSVYGATGLNPCYISGVEGSITLEGVNTDDATYYFTRSKEGDKLHVDYAEVETFSMKYLKGGVSIIWMGANGGWENSSSVRDYILLINQINEMIKYGEYRDYLVVLCREIGDISIINEFKREYGERFIHLKPLLHDYGLQEAGINITDVTYTNGIPSSLDAGDGLHLNFYGYPVVAKFIYKQLKKLEVI
jgi:hypothetical protein